MKTQHANSWRPTLSLAIQPFVIGTEFEEGSFQTHRRKMIKTPTSHSTPMDIAKATCQPFPLTNPGGQPITCLNALQYNKHTSAFGSVHWFARWPLLCCFVLWSSMSIANHWANPFRHWNGRTWLSYMERYMNVLSICWCVSRWAFTFPISMQPLRYVAVVGISSTVSDI